MTEPIRLSSGEEFDPKQPLTIQLEEPIAHGSEEITTLTFKPLRAKHLFDMPASGITIGDTLKLAAKVCGLPPSVIGELSVVDMGRAMEVVNAFLSRIPGTGAGDSAP